MKKPIIAIANRNLGWNSEIKKGERVVYFPSWINTVGTVTSDKGRTMIISANCITPI